MNHILEIRSLTPEISSALLPQQSLLRGDGDRRGARIDVEFLVDAGKVGLDSSFGNPEFIGDLFIPFAARCRLQNFQLALG